MLLCAWLLVLTGAPALAHCFTYHAAPPALPPNDDPQSLDFPTTQYPGRYQYDATPTAPASNAIIDRFPMAYRGHPKRLPRPARDPICRYAAPTLHIYLYCQAGPIDFDDPTGNYSSWEQFMGHEAQDAIAENYIDTHPWIDPKKILTGKRIAVKSRAYRYIMPDIVNLDAMQWLEIKPLSPTGIAAGALQFDTYSKLLKPLKMSPDLTWVPTPILTTETGEQIYVANCGGVVFYVEKDQIVDGAGFLAGVAAGMTAKQLYGFVARLTVSEAIPVCYALAANGNSFYHARLFQTVGCAALLSVLGGGVL